MRDRLEQFRAWRGGRPFWGGLMLVLAGLELLAIPSGGLVVKGAVKLSIYIGIGGVFGALIAVLLVVCGLASWYNQGHKTFYAIAGVLLGLAAFPASNLGGFLIGTLLAVFGGAAAYAWLPGEPVASSARGASARGSSARGSSARGASGRAATVRQTPYPSVAVPADLVSLAELIRKPKPRPEPGPTAAPEPAEPASEAGQDTETMPEAGADQAAAPDAGPDSGTAPS